MISVFQTQALQPSQVKSGVCAQGHIVKTPFSRESFQDYASGNLDLSRLKTNFFHTWQKCCETFTGTQLREKVFYLACNKMFLTKNKDTILGHNQTQEVFESEGFLESRAGLRKRFAGKLKYGALMLGSKFPHPLKRRKLHGHSRIVFDQAYDLKWLLGYLPDVFPLSASSANSNFDKETYTTFGYFRRRAVSYSRRVPYPTQQMWWNENSASVRHFSSLESLNPKSTPIDISAIMEKYQGLEEIYITNEAHFFINNLASESAKTEKKLSEIMSSFVKQNGVFRIHSAFSLEPPSIINHETILRPLLLVKDAKLCLQFPNSGKEFQATEVQNEPLFIEIVSGSPEYTSAQALSPSIQGILKELKLVRKLGEQQNSFTVPVWLNLLNTKQNQAKSIASSCVTKEHASSGIFDKRLDAETDT